MSGASCLLLRLSLLASLAVLVMAWSGEARAAAHGDGMHHQAMPCHPQQDTAADAPVHQHDGKSGGHGCPDCHCVASGCIVASLGVPQTRIPVDFTTQSLSPLAQPPLLRQAITGPPAEPPRT